MPCPALDEAIVKYQNPAGKPAVWSAVMWWSVMLRRALDSATEEQSVVWNCVVDL